MAGAGEVGDAAVIAYVTAGRHAPLLRYAYFLTGDLHRAEDLVQDTLTVLWERRERLEEVEDIAAYARRVLTNRYVSIWRRVLRRERVGALTEDRLVDEGAAQRVEDLDELRRGLAKLRPRERAALALRYYHDLPYVAVAEALGCSEGNARVIVSRALDRLRADPTHARASDNGPNH